MRTFKTEEHTFLFYDNIKEMPISQYKEFIKASLVDSGIGSTLEDVKSHVIRIYEFMNDDKKDLAQNELNNLFLCANYVQTKFSTTSYPFIYLLKSIDGERINFDDIDDEGIGVVQKKIETISQLSLSELVEEVKKNYNLN
jgi:hypothetical protein